MDIALKGFLQGSIPVVVFVGGAHHLTKKLKTSKPVLYYGSLLAGLGLAYAVVEGKIKAPFMNAEEDDLYYCSKCDEGFSSINPTDEGQFCDSCLPSSATLHDEMERITMDAEDERFNIGKCDWAEHCKCEDEDVHCSKCNYNLTTSGRRECPNGCFDEKGAETFEADSPRFIPVEVMKYNKWAERKHGKYKPHEVGLSYNMSYAVLVRDIPIAEFATKEEAEKHAKSVRNALSVLGGMTPSKEDHPLALKEMNAETFENNHTIEVSKGDMYAVRPKIRKWIRAMQEKGFSYIIRKDQTPGLEAYVDSPSEFLVYEIGNIDDITDWVEADSLDYGEYNDEMKLYISTKNNEIYTSRYGETNRHASRSVIYFPAKGIGLAYGAETFEAESDIPKKVIKDSWKQARRKAPVTASYWWDWSGKDGGLNENRFKEGFIDGWNKAREKVNGKMRWELVKETLDFNHKDYEVSYYGDGWNYANGMNMGFDESWKALDDEPIPTPEFVAYYINKEVSGEPITFEEVWADGPMKVVVQQTEEPYHKERKKVYVINENYKNYYVATIPTTYGGVLRKLEDRINDAIKMAKGDETFEASGTKKPKLTPKQKQALDMMKYSYGANNNEYAYVEVDDRGWKPHRTRQVQALLDKGLIEIDRAENKNFRGYVRNYESYIVKLTPLAWEYKYEDPIGKDTPYLRRYQQDGDKMV